MAIEGLEAAIAALEADGYDVHETATGTHYIADLAPDSKEYEGGAGNPEWDEECDRLRAGILRLVEPHGCSADWSDNDMRIELA